MELSSAVRTVSRHALKSGLGNSPSEHASFSAAWSAAQLRLLLSYMERHAATAETSLASLPEGEFRHALGVVLKDAADRCNLLSRDLDLARGETLGTTSVEDPKTSIAARVRRTRDSVPSL